MNANTTAVHYTDGPVRAFALAAVVWGVVGMLVGVLIAAQLAFPRPHLRHPVAELRAAAAAAHQRGDLRVRRLGAVRHQLPRGAAHLPGAAVPAQARGVHGMGLERGDRAGGHHAAAGHHAGQGVRRARVADRPADRGGLGVVCDRLLRHHRHPPRAPHLRRQLVLRRLHHRGGAAAHRQQRGDAGQPVEELLGLCRRAGRDGAVVVRPQRGGLLPDRRLPRDDVLLHPQAGRATDLLVPAVDRALLGPDLHLHVGGPAPPALHRAARLGAVGRHGVLAGAAGAELGRHDQRRDDAVGRLAQAARRPDPEVPDRLAVVLRHVDLRGADDVDQDGQRAERTTPTGRSATCTAVRSAGSA